MKNRGTAIVLALLLGGLGIHKFYLGRTGMGVLYLVFCWTFIPAFIAFIEFILLCVTSDAEFNRQFNGAAVAPTPAPAPAPAVTRTDVPQQIAALHELVKSGALTQNEFDERKQRLLAS